MSDNKRGKHTRAHRADSGSRFTPSRAPQGKTAMSDAASLLAWGRSIVAAKRSGHTAATASSSSSPSVVTASSSSTYPAAGRQEPHAQVEREQPAHQPSSTPKRKPAVASPSVVAGVAIRSFTGTPADDNEMSGNEPLEATEPHWQFLTRMDGSTTLHQSSMPGGGGTITSPTKINRAARAAPEASGVGRHQMVMNRRRGETKEPLPSHVSGRSGMGGDATASGAAQHTQLQEQQHAQPQEPSHILLVLQHEEEILRRRAEAEKRHVMELEMMRDRNREEFQQREKELLTEIENLPKSLQEADERRAARLSKSDAHVQEDDLKHLEEILWNVESRVHSLTAEEERYGMEVHAHAQCAGTSGSLALEARELLLESMYPALRRLPSVVDTLRRAALASCSSRSGHRGESSPTKLRDLSSLVDGNAVVDNFDVPGIHADVLLPMSVVRDRLHLGALPGGGGGERGPLAEGHSPERIFDAMRLILQTSVEPFLSDVSRVARALRDVRRSSIASQQLAAEHAEAQLAEQRLTMDDAHATLSDLARERDTIDTETSEIEAQLGEVHVQMDQASRTHSTEVLRANGLIQRKSSLEQEVRELKEAVAVSKREMSELQLAQRRHNLTYEANASRCEELREQSRQTLRSQSETCGSQVSQLQRTARAAEASLEQRHQEIQRMTDALALAKHGLAQTHQKLASAEQRLESHSSQKYHSEQERDNLHKEAEALHVAHQSAQQSMDALRQDTTTCRNEVYASRQSLRQLHEDVALLKDRVQDADEELELVRAVLLFQEEGGSRRAGGNNAHATAVAASKIAQDDMKVLWGESDGPTLPFEDGKKTRQTRSRTADERGKSMREEFGADDRAERTYDGHWAQDARNHEDEDHLGQHGRTKQWRSASRSSTEASPSAHTSTIHPPKELETVAPPPAWTTAAAPLQSRPTPMTVTPHPRHFHRELQALQASREAGRRELMDFLQEEERRGGKRTAKRNPSSDMYRAPSVLEDARFDYEPKHEEPDTAGETASSVDDGRSGSTRSVSDAGGVFPLHPRGRGVGASRGWQGATRGWQEAPSVVLAAHDRPPANTGSDDAQSTRSSSLYSSPPASEPDLMLHDRRRHAEAARPRGGHQDAAPHPHHQQVPPFMRAGGVPSRDAPPPTASFNGHLRPAADPLSDTAGRMPPSSALRGRLSQVKTKLQHVVADHSARKPFR